MLTRFCFFSNLEVSPIAAQPAGPRECNAARIFSNPCLAVCAELVDNVVD
jgi:hypothetical protein